MQSPAAANMIASKPADDAPSSLNMGQTEGQEKPQPQPRQAATATTKKKTTQPSMRYPFWFGGSASSMAACVTHPLDLVKVRLQVRRPDAPKSMSGTFAHIFRNHGVTGLYNGLSASLLRQMTYSTVRFGAYEEMKVRATRANGGKAPSFPVLVAMASASGFVGGISGNAADVLNVRMQQDAALPAAERRNYRHALEGMLRMAREEGLGSWFRGVLPNSMRAAAMTASQLASYDTFKGLLIGHTPMGDTLTTHFTASFLAGVMAATVTSPIDVIKTRVMSATTQEGLALTLAKIYKAEGFRWMFNGWVPSFLRLGPQTICTFIFLEMHRKVYRKATSVGDSEESSIKG
ncbi:mitochondrial carrier domain-containing protein [Colletotrichum navitas]|uniref:Mitochondrial carrier domain-containing protein n=1 Tax=Colletotrichum navitas TaxID=681940 RepID=A0AAD8Q3T5_9PEZI|nr:mitochondrial carrier domain-containing protein [Colletotrichum navitas]KAK1595018.1 mitochondrial carrier domain-containing protein [Colletotrichum navitas]